MDLQLDQVFQVRERVRVDRFEQSVAVERADQSKRRKSDIVELVRGMLLARNQWQRLISCLLTALRFPTH